MYSLCRSKMCLVIAIYYRHEICKSSVASFLTWCFFVDRRVLRRNSRVTKSITASKLCALKLNISCVFVRLLLSGRSEIGNRYFWFRCLRRPVETRYACKCLFPNRPVPPFPSLSPPLIFSSRTVCRVFEKNRNAQIRSYCTRGQSATGGTNLSESFWTF